MKKIICTLLLFLLPLTAASAAGITEMFYRSGIGVPIGPNVPQISEASTATEKILLVFLAVIDFFLYIGGIGATVMIVVAGLRLTFSAGSEEQIDGARRTVLYAVLGLIAAFVSLIVVQNIADLFYRGSIV